MSIYRTYDSDYLLKEFEKLAQISRELSCPRNESLRRRNVGYCCSNAFFQYERLNTARRGHLSTIDFFERKHEYIKSKSHKGDLQSYVSFLNHTPSQFPPNVAIWFYKNFRATHIFDPFAGWGDRCIAAMASGVWYTGVDSNPNLKKPFEDMIDFYKERKVKFINKAVQEVNLDDINFDFVFSSPPFWDSGKKPIELYHSMTHSSSQEEFMNKVLIPLINYCRKKAPVCLYINDHMAEFLWKNEVRHKQVFSYKGAGNKKKQTYAIYQF